ncbi:S9 family peptidase [Thalassobacillus hwangdonensis]|uniref:Prolyl oligopeptidase family serine peptidase n=1 Tax=Thalassobacillus hwangdonensis TaxID=546108 RepID=A0ABW3L2D2_9BACI
MGSNESTYLSIKELASLPALSAVTISEDGENVAFVKTTADWKDNTYNNHIWVYEKNKRECYPLIEGASPLWSPDSNQIAYLLPVGDEKKNQIFVESLDGSDRVQITDEQEGISSFKWDPSCKGLYYVAQAEESEEIKRRRETYGDFQYISKDYRNHRLHYIEADSTSMARTLTDDKDFHIHQFDISSDGDTIVFMATPSSDMADSINGALYILDRKTGELKKVPTDKLLGGSVCISPDGSKICYTASIREKDYYKIHIQDNTLEIYDLNTGERSHPLIEVDSTVTPLRWMEKGILIKWQDKTNYLVGMLSKNGTVEKLSEDGFVMEASITTNGEHLAYSKAASNETFEVYLDNEKITDENSFFKRKLKSNREIITWKSSDDLEIEGVLTTSADFDPNKTYPLLVFIHGGPGWASFPIHSGCFNEKYPVEQFVEKGFIVLEPNYRGSTGYGNEFLKANYRNQGIGDYQDIISGVDTLVEKGIADKGRVGVMGWSNGGFISAFCSTYSDRFKAASVGGGITNWSTHYATTDIPYYIRMYMGDTPWNDSEVYRTTSPINYIQSACTPTLIQHGEVDARIPVSNAFELYQGLKDMEVETELVIFKGMAYSSAHPGVNVAIMKQNLMWFSHYILGESMQGFRGL